MKLAVLSLVAFGLVLAAALSLAARTGEAAAPFAGTPPVCSDDLYEQNDTRDSAPPLLQPVDVTNLVSCPNDTDWFEFHLFAGDNIAIDVTYDDSNGDLDVSLHGPGGELWATATPVATGDQHVAFSAPASGIYYVRIDPPPGATEAIDYTLALSGARTPTPTLTFTPTLTSTGTPTPTPEKALGDVNDDGRVDAIDAALVLQRDAGLVVSLPNLGSADTNDDGLVNSIDASIILQHVAGLITLS